MEVHLWFDITQTLLLYTWTNRESLHEPHSPWHREASANRLLQSKREQEAVIDVTEEGWGGRHNKLRKSSWKHLAKLVTKEMDSAGPGFIPKEPQQALGLPSPRDKAGWSLNSDTMCRRRGTTGCSQV